MMSLVLAATGIVIDLTVAMSSMVSVNDWRIACESSSGVTIEVNAR
jgi:hypothetical protein